MTFTTRGHIGHRTLIHNMGNMFGYYMDNAEAYVAKLSAEDAPTSLSLKQTQNIEHSGWFNNTFEIARCQYHLGECYLIWHKHEMHQGTTFWYGNLSIAPVDFLLQCRKHKQYPRVLDTYAVASILKPFCALHFGQKLPKEINEEIIQHILANQDMSCRITNDFQLRIIPNDLHEHNTIEVVRDFLVVKTNEDYPEKPFLLVRIEKTNGLSLGSTREILEYSLILENFKKVLEKHMK